MGTKAPTQYLLEDVYSESGFPELTFVKPNEYSAVKSAMRQKGKHLTITGPSGVGKTTLVKRLLRDLQIGDQDVLFISGKTYSHCTSILQVITE